MADQGWPACVARHTAVASSWAAWAAWSLAVATSTRATGSGRRRGAVALPTAKRRRSRAQRHGPVTDRGQVLAVGTLGVVGVVAGGDQARCQGFVDGRGHQ